MSDFGNADDPEAFTDDLPLTNVFGDHLKTRIISALLSGSQDPRSELRVSKSMRIAGVGPDTFAEHVDVLRSHGIITETDELDDEVTDRLDDGRAVVADIR